MGYGEAHEVSVLISSAGPRAVAARWPLGTPSRCSRRRGVCAEWRLPPVLGPSSPRRRAEDQEGRRSIVGGGITNQLAHGVRSTTRRCSSGPRYDKG
jgi:hypothetical protein